METSDESACDVVFKAAVEIVQSLPKKGMVSITVNQKLRFYSLFKQGMVGKCNVPCPPFWQAVDRMKWRAWNALGSMEPLQAKKAYISELKGIIDRVLREYDLAELAKQSGERTKVLLREKFAVLGYDDGVLQLGNMPKEINEKSNLINSNEANELSDQCSESSTSATEYFDSICCDTEPCICCEIQVPNQRREQMDSHHPFPCIFDGENLKKTLQKYLKIIVDLLMYLRRLFLAFSFSYRGWIGNRRKLTVFAIILPFIAHFIMAYLY